MGVVGDYSGYRGSLKLLLDLSEALYKSGIIDATEGSELAKIFSEEF
jgi:hypothetical protein